MIKFQELREKSVKGIGVVPRYLINPTPTEALNFMKNTKEKSIRLLSDNNNLYIWDGYYAIHDDFRKNELFLPGLGSSNYDMTEISHRANLDPFIRDEGSHLGYEIYKKHKKFITNLLNAIEKEYNGEWEFDKQAQNYMQIFFTLNT